MKLITSRTLNYFWEKCRPTVEKIAEDKASELVKEALDKKVTGEGLTFSVIDGILTVTYQEK